MPPRKKTTTPKIVQLHVSLKHIEPPIWRRVLVDSKTSLAELHLVLQDVMGWTNSHLHAFHVGERQIGDLKQDDGRLGFEDERKVRLGEVARVGRAFLYEYDFGDGWEHQVTVEAVMEPDGRLQYPLVVAGARACPPEDVGGPGGYERLLEVLANPQHEEHDDLLTWSGGAFDPEGYDRNVVNHLLFEARSR